MAESTIKHEGFYLLFVSLALAAGAGFLAAQAHFDYGQHAEQYLDLNREAGSRMVEAQFHRARGGVSSMAMIEEASRDAPPKDLTSKRLALSIALTKNGTGFEDRFVERAMQNATEDELNQFRNSFLTSLFESAPSSLRRQEVIQMHMDVLQNELRHAARLIGEAKTLQDQAVVERSQSNKAAIQSVLCWKALILLFLAAILSLASLHYHKPWMVYISGAITLYGGILIVRAMLL